MNRFKTTFEKCFFQNVILPAITRFNITRKLKKLNQYRFILTETIYLFLFCTSYECYICQIICVIVFFYFPNILNSDNFVINQKYMYENVVINNEIFNSIFILTVRWLMDVTRYGIHTWKPKSLDFWGEIKLMFA